MKQVCYVAAILVMAGCAQSGDKKQAGQTAVAAAVAEPKQASYFIDEHDLEPGKVKFDDVAGAHKKDLATQEKYGVNFIKYWVDEQGGKVFCLSKTLDGDLVTKVHREAHGLLPAAVYKVTDGPEAVMAGNKTLYLDVHKMEPGTFTAKDVAGAHEKDLAVEKKHGVNFINYWVDEKAGMVMCLSEAPDSAAVTETHKEAHGLLPASVRMVKQGQ